MEKKEKKIRAGVLEAAYEESGPPDGFPVILLHGFPDDVRAWDEVAPRLAAEGLRVIVPYLRGFGPTRFADPSTPRVGEQAALGRDVIDIMDALALPRAVLAGYDWGCTAACAASILSPDRVTALLAIQGYGVNDTVSPEQPAPPTEERECWYHWYFHLERGRRALEANRREICLLLWRSWSPTWTFSGETFDRTASSFDNPDFIPIVIHAYRHWHGNAAGDPALAEAERLLARQPPIAAPSMVLHGADDAVHPPYRSLPHMNLFPPGTRRVVVPGAGHFVPREKPGAVVEAVRELYEAVQRT